MADVIIRELDSDGFAYINVYARRAEGAAMMLLSYKVDSGANCTTISLSKLKSLGYDEKWVRKNGKLLKGKERPHLANGKPVDNCYVISIPEISMSGNVGYNWPMRVSLNPDVQFRLLFGTDSMRFFNWEFDYGHNVFKYRFIPGKRKLLFNNKEQSMHSVENN